MAMRSSARAVLVAFLVVLVTLAAGAAGLPVTGKVVDPAGAAVPGATVELLAGTNSVAKSVSATDGTFRFADVPAGNYRVRVTLAGFRATEMSFVVGTATPAPLTVKLLIGSISETVKVTAESPMVTRVQGPPGLPAPAPPPFAGDQNYAAPGQPMRYGGIVGGGGRGIYQPSAEVYEGIEENTFRRPTEHPLSTFSIDVDTASYANVRRFLNEGRLPPADAVRVEELINYFHFEYADSTQGAPFGITTELAPCPWNSTHKLALVGLQARRLPEGKTPPRNLVFLLDVSGSMTSQD
jgi:Ca-activated chloride channel family protein